MMAIAIMPSKCFQILIITSLVVLSSTFLISTVDSSATIGDVDVGGWLVSAGRSSCDGTIGECVDQDDDEEEFVVDSDDDDFVVDSDDEFMVDSESNRRSLRWRRRYISYGALRRNRVPCSRRGASYYNCRPGASANPYRRGCNRISRCRRR